MLDTLHRRPRGRGLAEVLARVTHGRVPGAAAPGAATPLPEDRIVRALMANRAPAYREAALAPTRDLLARLDRGDGDAVFAALDAETRATWDDAPEWMRDHLTLIFGVYHQVPGVLDKTGLVTAMPPDDVHAMGRGPLAAGGDFWTADLLGTAIQDAGVQLAEGDRVLDFGCSSGRHLRVLRAWRPGVRWMGCDPNAGAIAWAGASLEGIEFFVSPLEPPLDLDPGSLDAVTSVSVWSHFGAGAALRWLNEMARLVRPGGVLVLTIQGAGSLAYFLQGGHVGPDYARRVGEELLAEGHAWVEAFGAEGDWGVKHPEWGMGYMTLEWLAERALGDWTLERFEPRRIDANQDLVAMRRR
jgi:SAM-dependent methyltransferase